MDTIDELLRGLRVADDDRLVAGKPDDDGWVRVADAIGDATWVDRRLAATLAHADGIPRVAASYQASWLAYALVVPLARAVVHLDRAWSLDPSQLWLHPTEGGWYDGLAIDPTAMMLGPSPDGLEDGVAGGIVALMTPLFVAIDRASGLGTPCMWGSLADAIGSGCVTNAAARGTDVGRAFERASELIAAIGRSTRLPRVRPRLVDLSTPGAEPRRAVRRGTCCLWYRTQQHPDPSGEGFCDDCPRRDPEDQRRRWLAAGQAAG